MDFMRRKQIYPKMCNMLRVAILKDEDEKILDDLLKDVNSYAPDGVKMLPIEEWKEHTITNYVLHYQAGKDIAVNVRSVIGMKLKKEAEAFNQ